MAEHLRLRLVQKIFNPHPGPLEAPLRPLVQILAGMAVWLACRML